MIKSSILFARKYMTFYRRLSTRVVRGYLQEAFQALAEAGGFAFADGENEAAGGAFVSLAEDAGLHILDDSHDVSSSG